MPRRVLVIDDSLEIAESFARMLEAMGHCATFVINPLDALDAAEGIQAEVIFIDIDMPKIDGWELARLLRGRFGYDAVRLVAVTALGRPEDRARSRRAGFDAHLVKPLPADTLRAALEAVFDSARAAQPCAAQARASQLPMQ